MNAYCTSSSSSSSCVWSVWNQQQYSGQSASVWTTWCGLNQVQGAYSSLSTDSTWLAWQVQSNVHNSLAANEIAAQVRRDREEAEAKRQAARRRAKKLLRSLITDEQSDSLERDNSFIVTAPKSKSRYRIQRGYQGNVFSIDDAGRAIYRYCAHHADPNIPTEDHMVTQMLMLLHDEEAFLRIANRTPA